MTIENLNIVLVNTDTTNGIKCKKFNISDVKFYAISYCWNYLEKWYVNTSYYNAPIISFKKDIFIKLCNQYRSEIEWFWIDTISMDQSDNEDTKKERKKTINRMSEIYRKAAKVLAVPDLGYRDNYNDDWKGGRYDDIDIKRSMKTHIIQRWIDRTWVVSERIIGVQENKLEVYFLSTNEIVDINEIMEWEDNFSDKKEVEHPVKMLECIIDTKCVKFEDRFKSIFPLTTKYKIPETGNIESKEKFKIILLDILNPIDKILFILRELNSGKCNGSTPTFITSYEKGILNPNIYDNGEDWCDINFYYDKIILNISAKYIKIKDKYYIFMCQEYVNQGIYEIHCLKCIKNEDKYYITDDESFWHSGICNIGDELEDIIVKYGSFTIY